MEFSHIYRTEILSSEEKETKESKKKRQDNADALGFLTAMEYGPEKSLLAYCIANDYEEKYNRKMETIVTFLVTYFDLSKETIQAVKGYKGYEILSHYLSDTKPYPTALKTRIRELTSKAELTQQDYQYFYPLAKKNNLKEEENLLLQSYQETEYNKAIELQKTRNFKEAIRKFKGLNDYQDSQKQMESCQEEEYKLAQDLRKNRKYQEAISLFKELGDYRDSKEQLKETTKDFLYSTYLFQGEVKNEKDLDTLRDYRKKLKTYPDHQDAMTLYQEYEKKEERYLTKKKRILILSFTISGVILVVIILLIILSFTLGSSK